MLRTAQNAIATYKLVSINSKNNCLHKLCNCKTRMSLYCAVASLVIDLSLIQVDLAELNTDTLT